MNAPVLPGGDPALLEQLAGQLTQQASQAGDLAVTTAGTTSQIRSGAQWDGSAADAYTGFTTAMSRGLGRTAAPLADILRAAGVHAELPGGWLWIDGNRTQCLDHLPRPETLQWNRRSMRLSYRWPEGFSAGSGPLPGG